MAANRRPTGSAGRRNTERPAARENMQPPMAIDGAPARRDNVEQVYRRVREAIVGGEIAPGMRDRGWGRIVHVVSDTVRHPPDARMLAYVTSKAALIGMTRVLALDLGRHGITVNAVAPGLTRTHAASADVSDAEFESVRAQQALPRPLVPDDVAATVAYLCTDAAEAITGQTLNVDGGLIFR